jgi:glycine/D-amino acid oxidase-like deaminating enzyme
MTNDHRLGNIMTTPQTRPAMFAGTAIIVGASLSGLMAALSLSRIGMSVTMLERSDDNGRTGASLSAVEGMLERLTGRPPTADEPAMPGGIQTWVAVHDRLRGAVDRDPAINLRWTGVRR